MNHIITTGGTWDEIDLRCPKCNSKQILVKVTEEGYYEIVECHRCDYKNKENP